MKDNFIHVCFVIDESGSMAGSESDVVGGFQKVLNDQKALKDGTCAISLYKFNSVVTEVYKGKDINQVEPLKADYDYTSMSIRISSLYNEEGDIPEDTNFYSPGGCTAMYDGIGMAIDNIGKWLSNMPEEERPSKNLIVIMTDGEENSSIKYSASKIKEMIKEQEEKYSWTFVYMGTDITTKEYADSIGITNASFTTRDDHIKNYDIISKAACCYRSVSSNFADSAINAVLGEEILNAKAAYKTKTGIDIDLT